MMNTLRDQRSKTKFSGVQVEQLDMYQSINLIDTSVYLYKFDFQDVCPDNRVRLT